MVVQGKSEEMACTKSSCRRAVVVAQIVAVEFNATASMVPLDCGRCFGVCRRLRRERLMDRGQR